MGTTALVIAGTATAVVALLRYSLRAREFRREVRVGRDELTGNPGFTWDHEKLEAIEFGTRVTIEYVELVTSVDLTQAAHTDPAELIVDADWVGVGFGLHTPSAPVAIVIPAGTRVMRVIALCEIRSITELRVFHPEPRPPSGPTAGSNDVSQREVPLEAR